MSKFRKPLTVCLFLIAFTTGYKFIPARYESFAQETDLECALDVKSRAVPLPKIFRPNIDLSGRGLNLQDGWPTSLATLDALDAWQRDLGSAGLYRLQYSLWEIQESAKDEDTQEGLLNNYEDIIKKITDAGGTVILDIFGTPAGLGKVLDKKSSPRDLAVFKDLVKSYIKEFSCDKRYNIWYEVWSAPDLDGFFLGRKQEYLNLYLAVATAIKELEVENKIHIPVGGPSVSWWFQNMEGNTILSPEKSLIYDLVRFCFRYKLPLDFISWHAYSTDPRAEEEVTIYKKNPVSLIRAWLSYFHFDSNTPLIIDEWNYDSDANILPERSEKANICASYIPARIKKMYAAGLDYQLYFSLEDFYNTREGIVRNVGIFLFNADPSGYKAQPKSVYNMFRMLGMLGDELFASEPNLNDEFVDMIATKSKDYVAIIIYNYIDPDINKNFLSRNISALSESERIFLLKRIDSDRLDKVMRGKMFISSLRTSKRVKKLLNKSQELNVQAARAMVSSRRIKLSLKNLSGKYLYQRYNINSSCSINCGFTPVEEKEIAAADLYQETFSLSPYSVDLIIFKKKPPEVKSAEEVREQPVEQPAPEGQEAINK